jgi:hypothetical protein
MPVLVNKIEHALRGQEAECGHHLAHLVRINHLLFFFVKLIFSTLFYKK